MNMIHTDRNGNRMLIANMDDKHLVNSINLLLRKAVSLRKAADASIHMNELDMALYKLEEISPEVAGKRIGEILDVAAPYIIEAYLRGLTEPVGLLREALGREGGNKNLLVATVPLD